MKVIFCKMNSALINKKTLIKETIINAAALLCALCILLSLQLFKVDALLNVIIAGTVAGLIMTFYYLKKLERWRLPITSMVLLSAPGIGFFYLERLNFLNFLPTFLTQSLCLAAAVVLALAVAYLPKELTLYLFFGGLTTLVSVGSFTLFDYLFGSEAHAGWLLPQTASFIVSCLFAFFTNRSYVFESRGNIILEALRFIGVRFLTSLFFEFILLGAFVDLLQFNRDLSKILCAVIVVISNYFLSKLFVFAKK